MTTKELIRTEIERRMKELEEQIVDIYDSKAVLRKDELQRLLSFLDALPDESERPTMGYDEAYLNEKIAKASKSWEGVDVDKFMDEIRGREKTVTDCDDLTEAAKKYAEEQAFWWIRENPYTSQEYAFKAGAEWMKTKMIKEDAK